MDATSTEPTIDRSIVEQHLDDTISVITPCIGFIMRFKKNQLLVSRIVAVRKSMQRERRPLELLVEYPIGSGHIFASPSSSSASMYLDFGYLRIEIVWFTRTQRIDDHLIVDRGKQSHQIVL